MSAQMEIQGRDTQSYVIHEPEKQQSLFTVQIVVYIHNYHECKRT